MREKILSELKRLAAANDGEAPGRDYFERQTGIKQSEWLGKYWAKWSDAVKDANLQPREFNQKHDSNEILQKLAIAFRHFGKIPTKAELQLYKKANPEFPWHSSLESHFRSKSSMLIQLKSWIESNLEFSDVLTIFPAKIDLESDEKKSDGYVYLLRSGLYFKIGRGEQLEKRIKQIRVALPDEAVLEHAIRTDDPSGIEAYWHRRFQERRANGEWFKLTNSDVTAFKKRKFQ